MKFKASLFLIIYCLLNTATQAQLNKTFGTYWNGTQEIFTSIDMTSGAVTDIATLTGVSGILNFSSSFDPNNGLYIAQTDLGISVVDISTGSIVNNFATANGLKGLEYDPVSSKLYASYWSGTDEIFISMDLTSGLVTEIDTLIGVQYLVNMTTTFDADNGYYISQTNLGITVIDISTASIINVFPTSNDLKGLEYDPLSSTLFASYYSGTEEIFTSMNMTTGVFTDIAPLPGVMGIVNLTSTFDPENGLYITQSNLGVHVIDIQTAAILNTFTPTNALKILEFPYCYFADETDQITITKASICETNFSQLSAFNNSYTYLWNNGETTNSIIVNDSADYYVELTNNYGCKTTSDEVAIKVFDCNLFVDSLNFTMDSCLFDSTTIIMAYTDNVNSSNDTVYLTWNIVINTGDTILQNAEYYFSATGVYVISINGNCTGKTNSTDFFYDMIELKSTVSSIENINNSKITVEIYPNPSENELFISSNDLIIEKLKIIDIKGNIIKEINDEQNSINISEFPSGIYFIHVISENNSIMKKIIKP